MKNNIQSFSLRYLFKLLFVLIIALFFCSFFDSNYKVYASKKGIQEIKPGKVYTMYDVTGDKIADSVKMTVKKNNKHKYDYSETMKISINNSVALKITDDAYNWSVKLLFINSDIAIFEISYMVASDDVALDSLFQYKNRKLESVYDLQKNTSLGYTNNHYLHLRKVVGNKIHYRILTQFLTTGGFLSFDITVKYEYGKFKILQKSNEIKYEKARYNKWTVNKKLKIYKKAGSKKLLCVLKRNDKIKINAVVYKNQKIYFKIKNTKGEAGYLPATKDPSRPFCFKETVYSG